MSIPGWLSYLRHRPNRETPLEELLEAVVPHPRFGSRPIPSGIKLPKDREITDNWKYAFCLKAFPETAIPAVTSYQRTPVPIPYYLDVLEICIDCQRSFIFFALEQKHWFEVLGFSIYSRAKRCPDCRRKERRPRLALGRYSKLIVRDDLSEKEMLQLVKDTTLLWLEGILKREDCARRILNQARKRAKKEASLAPAIEALENALLTPSSQ